MIARPGRRPRRVRDDAGFSLMEVMVGSALMSVVMAVATAGFVNMYHTTDYTEANALTATNLMASFAKLDSEIRYAYRINAPYQPDSATFAVDYVIPDTNHDDLQCVQLTLPVAGGALVRRQWAQASTSASATVSGVATNLVTAASNVSPFTVRTTGQDASNFDRLQIDVNSTVGVTNQGTTRNYDLQFTALNTQDLTNDLTCTKA